MSLTEKEEEIIKNFNNFYLKKKKELETQINELKKIIKEKDEKIKELEIQIIYQPGGSGAIQAEEHFNSLQKNNFPDDNFEDQNEKINEFTN